MKKLTYPVFVDGEPGAYGVVFHDMDGVVAMGDTVEEALSNAKESLLDYFRSCAELGETVKQPSKEVDVSVPEGSTRFFVTVEVKA